MFTTERCDPRSRLRMMVLAVALVSPAIARPAQPVSPAPFARWTDEAAPLAASATPDAHTPQVEIGRAYRVRLKPAAAVRLADAPEGAKAVADAHAGLLRLRIARAGTYGVALSTPVWVDVLRDGKLVQESGHGHVEGTTIRKVVEFPLMPGDHLIQLAANPGAETRLMVAPAVRAGE